MSNLETLKAQHPECSKCGRKMVNRNQGDYELVYDRSIPGTRHVPMEPDWECELSDDEHRIARLESDLAAAQATIAELVRHKSRMRDMIVSAIQGGVDHWWFKEALGDKDFEEFESVSDAYEKARCERKLLRSNLAAAQATIAELEAKLEKEERDCLSVIAERDHYHEKADELAEGIARHLGDDFGEHSSANSPWDNAIEALDEADSLAAAKATIRDLERENKARANTMRDVEQIAGKALGYPWFKDDHKNFPNATEQDGVCIGDHVTETIVEELASKFQQQARELEEADWMFAFMVETAGMFVALESDSDDEKRFAAGLEEAMRRHSARAVSEAKRGSDVQRTGR